LIDAGKTTRAIFDAVTIQQQRVRFIFLTALHEASTASNRKCDVACLASLKHVEAA
jgi:hypothetical protein